MAEEPQTPGHDRLGDRRLSGTDTNFVVGDMRSEGNLQNVPKAQVIERIKSLADTVTSHISEPYRTGTTK